MAVLEVLKVVFPVFSIIAIGYWFASFKKIDITAFTELLVYVAIPALVISSISKNPINVEDLIEVSLASVAVILLTGLLCLLYFKVTKKEFKRGFFLTSMFMNGGNMPFPLALLAFGEKGLQIAVIYYIAASIVVYSLGLFIAKGRGGQMEMFKLPLIYASSLAVGMNLANIQIPFSIMVTIDMVGDITIALMQITLGYSLYKVKITSIEMPVVSTLIRIGGGFLIALFIVEAFNIEGLNKKIILLTSSMPSAVINVIFGHKYDLDTDLISSTVFLSTLVSVLTTPLLLYFLMA